MERGVVLLALLSARMTTHAQARRQTELAAGSRSVPTFVRSESAEGARAS